MAKSKNIGGTVYLPVKQHDECRCSKCGAYISSKDKVYVCMSSGNISCFKCMDKLFAQERLAKEHNAKNWPVNKPLYVGLRHDCGKQVYETVSFYFSNGSIKKKIQVKLCHKCGKYIVETDTYKRNVLLFEAYRMINTKTNKDIIKLNGFVRSVRGEDKHALEATPQEQWAAKHPYQGGGFSGK